MISPLRMSYNQKGRSLKQQNLISLVDVGKFTEELFHLGHIWNQHVHN